MKPSELKVITNFASLVSSNLVAIKSKRLFPSDKKNLHGLKELAQELKTLVPKLHKIDKSLAFIIDTFADSIINQLSSLLV